MSMNLPGEEPSPKKPTEEERKPESTAPGLGGVGKPPAPVTFSNNGKVKLWSGWVIGLLIAALIIVAAVILLINQTLSGKAPQVNIPSGWMSWSGGKPEEPAAVSFSKIIPAPKGYLWFVEQDSGQVDQYDPSQNAWSKPAAVDLPDNPKPLAFDGDGALWLGGNGGAWIVSSGRQTHLTTDQGLPSNEVTAVAFTPDRLSWIGTRAGLAVYDGNKITDVLTRDKAILMENHVTFLKTASDGSLWVGTEWGLSVRKPDGKWERYRAPEVFSDEMQYVSGIAEGKDGTMWVATHGDGIYSFTKEMQWSRLITGDPGVELPSPTLASVAADKNGNVWMGVEKMGVTSYDGKNWKTYTTADGLISNMVNDIYVDASGVLWFATDGGVSRYKP